MRRLFSVALVLIAAYLLAGVLFEDARAQSPCSHVQFRIDSSMEVDRGAICDAAVPWREQGIQVYVYLTDQVPRSEDEWFSLLDQIEMDAGLRAPGDEGSFRRNGLAFEASTKGNVPWTNTITYGEDLFDSSLDTDSALERIKEAMYAGLQENDATKAFVDAISASYEVSYPPPSRSGLVIGSVAVLGLGGGLLYLVVGRPALRKRRQEEELAGHLLVVQQNVANLLLAAERLLDGERPQETVLFQLYEANGGGFDPERTAEVTEWIRRSQAALSDSFDLRRDLVSAEAGQQGTLEQQVRNWEMIYLTLVGSTPRVANLMESELRDLLNPLVVLEREAGDVPLAEQLDAIRREIAGMPLKVELMEVDPATVDREGILGYIDHIEAAIKDLMDAQRAAPETLADAQRELSQTKEEADKASPFGLTGNVVLAGIAKRLAEAETLLIEGNALGAVGLMNRANRDLEIIDDLIAAADDHKRRMKALDEVTAAGYQPPNLLAEKAEIESDIDAIRQAVQSGEYLKVDTWVDELDADGDLAVELAQRWRERQQFNEESIRLMKERLESVQSLEDEARPAWEALQSYPESNWEDIAPGLQAITKMLDKIRGKELPRIIQLNSMNVQEVPQAEALLADTGQALLNAERQLQGLINRVAEVRAAEVNLPDGLVQAQKELVQAVSFRDMEDQKVGPDVDFLLKEAAKRLRNAAELQQIRAYIPAMNAHLEARKKTAEGLSMAQRQVAEIEQLESDLVAAKAAAESANGAANTAGQKQLSAAHTDVSAAQLADANDALSEARQSEASTMPLEDKALGEALAATILRYRVAITAAIDASAQLELENEQHEQLYRQTAIEVAAAQTAILAAEGAVHNSAARGEGKEALQRAQRTLRKESISLATNKEELMAVLEDAQRAKAYAEEAERKARAAIRYRMPRQQVPFPMPPTPFGRVTSGGTILMGGRPRTSNRSMQRSSASPSRGSARRSSSFGGASRSSSMGSSRRSSGGGSRRR